MLSIQHIVCSVLNSPDKQNYLEQTLGAKIYPDAIRAYIGARGYTHFEEGENKQDISYFRYPASTKATKEDVLKLDKSLAKTPPCVIGENSILEKFQATNKSLPKVMYNSIEAHLVEDKIFDEFIRTHIDCSDKYEDHFVFQGTELNGKEVRELIGQIEQEGFYHLAYLLHVKSGIICNQAWLQEYIKPLLEKAYPADLAQNTFNYMNIDPTIDQYISNHDWSHLSKCILHSSDYLKLYETISKETTPIYAKSISGKANEGKFELER